MKQAAARAFVVGQSRVQHRFELHLQRSGLNGRLQVVQAAGAASISPATQKPC
jgi:hypothetical protein